MDEHQDDNESPDFLEQLLAGFLGKDGAKEASDAMRSAGFDIGALGGFGSPQSMSSALGQFRYLMQSSNDPVNWSMVRDIAKQTAYQSGDPKLTAAQAAQVRQALSIADLWLDPVTDFALSQATRHAWTRGQWVSSTLPAWKKLFNPIADNVARAMGEVLEDQVGSQPPEELGHLAAGLSQMIPKMAALSFGSQIGQALAAMASQSFGTSDSGFPLTEPGVAALVPTNIAAFSDGFDQDFEVIQQYIALREAAHARLFSSVPWLRHDLELAIIRYAKEIAIDQEAIAQAAASIDPRDPASLNEIAGAGLFSAEPTDAQIAALQRLETLLSLIEGWVETVVASAAAPYLPEQDKLQEMLRRRRVTGSAAEKALGELVGLKLRPRMARGAAEIFRKTEQLGGPSARDGLWRHPDLVPTWEDLEHPENYGSPRPPQVEDDEFEKEMRRLLDGTLGWDENVPEDRRAPSPKPDTDPDAEQDS